MCKSIYAARVRVFMPPSPPFCRPWWRIIRIVYTWVVPISSIDATRPA